MELRRVLVLALDTAQPSRAHRLPVAQIVEQLVVVSVDGACVRVIGVDHVVLRRHALERRLAEQNRDTAPCGVAPSPPPVALPVNTSSTTRIAISAIPPRILAGFGTCIITYF